MNSHKNDSKTYFKPYIFWRGYFIMLFIMVAGIAAYLILRGV